MKYFYKLGFVIVATVALYGFMVFSTNSIHASDIAQAQSGGVDDSHPSVRLIIADNALRKDIQLLKARVSFVGRLKRGQVSVLNNTDSRLMLEYKFDWYDDQGFLVEDGGIWERFALGGGELRSFATTGKSATASFVQFTIRTNNDSFMHNKVD